MADGSAGKMAVELSDDIQALSSMPEGAIL